MTNPAQPAAELDLSAGIYLKGTPLSPTSFLAATNFRQLRQITMDPAYLQLNGRRRAGDDDYEIAQQRDLHDLVQRAITGSKKTNVPKYQAYIAGIVSGDDGVLPPIHLWTEQPLDVVTAGQTYALVPNGDTLLAIDGETQLTAHWALARSADVAIDLKQKHSVLPLGVVLHHGVSTGVARQYFHDLNILAVRPNVGVGLSMDTKDAVMGVVGDVESAVPTLVGRVERQARQLPKRTDKLVTISALRQMVINIAKGISGVQYGSRPAPLEDDEIKKLSSVAIRVVGDYFERFGEQIADREQYLVGAAPVLAAVGAMANRVFDAPEHERAALWTAILRSLDSVDWRRGAQWQGVAGDFTSRGVFSVKGTKEVSYAVFNALTDNNTPGFSRIRSREDGFGG